MPNISKDELNKLVFYIQKGRMFFCDRKYFCNKYVQYSIKEQLKQPFESGFLLDDEAIEKSVKYKKIFESISVALQNMRIIETAKLVDYEGAGDRTSLSLKYVASVGDADIKSKIDTFLAKYNKFLDSIKGIRNTSLAHNNLLGPSGDTIYKGVEDFYEDLVILIPEIEESFLGARTISISLGYIDKLSESGFDDLYSSIQKDISGA